MSAPTRSWRLCCAALALSAPLHVLRGQALDRSKPPVASAPAPFAFPKMQTRTLANGLRVIIVEDHSLPLVAVRAVVVVDSINDPVGKEGLYVLTAGMLREGTASRTGEQLAAASAALGNVVFPFRFTTITSNFNRSLELMADMLIRPSFPQPALDRLKATLTATQQRMLQSAGTIPNKILLTQLYSAEHPLARSTLASSATMAPITRDELHAFHETYFRPNNASIVVVGDVHESDVLSTVTKHFGSWARGSVPELTPPAVTARRATTIYLLDRPAAPQSYVAVGTLGPDRTSADFAALEVMAPILGGSTASRLYQNLRDRHSYMYAGAPASLTWRPGAIPSLIGGSASVATAKTDSALIEWLGELRGMRERQPSDQEMTFARAALTGTLPAQIETDDLIANRVMFMIQNGVPLDFYNSYGDRIAKVTPAQVRAAAGKYVDLSHLVIVVAGDRTVIEPLLRAANIAPIVIVDESGKS